MFAQPGHNQRQAIDLLFKFVDLMLLTIGLGFDSFGTRLCDIGLILNVAELPTLSDIPEKVHDVSSSWLTGLSFGERSQGPDGSPKSLMEKQPPHPFPRLDIREKRQAVDRRFIQPRDSIDGDTRADEFPQSPFFALGGPFVQQIETLTSGQTSGSERLRTPVADPRENRPIGGDAARDQRCRWSRKSATDLVPGDRSHAEFVAAVAHTDGPYTGASSGDEFHNTM